MPAELRSSQFNSGTPHWRGWGPALPTEIWRLKSGSAHWARPLGSARWDLELAVEVRQCALRSGARSWPRGEVQGEEVEAEAASTLDKIWKPLPSRCGKTHISLYFKIHQSSSKDVQSSNQKRWETFYGFKWRNNMFLVGGTGRVTFSAEAPWRFDQDLWRRLSLLIAPHQSPDFVIMTAIRFSFKYVVGFLMVFVYFFIFSIFSRTLSRCP